MTVEETFLVIGHMYLDSQCAFMWPCKTEFCHQMENRQITYISSDNIYLSFFVVFVKTDLNDTKIEKMLRP